MGLLVVDDHKTSGALLCTRLRRHGLPVELAATYAPRVTPQLVILSQASTSDALADEAHTWIVQLGGEPQTQKSLIALPRPIAVDEVVDWVRLLLTQSPNNASPWRIDSLAMPLQRLLVLLRSAQQTFAVEVSAFGLTGHIQIEAGRVSRGHVGSLSGQAAVALMLAWGIGQLTVRRALEAQTTAGDLFDSAKALAAEIGHARSTLEWACRLKLSDKLIDARSFPAQLLDVLSTEPEGTSVAALLTQSPPGPVLALSCLKSAVASGYLEKREPWRPALPLLSLKETDGSRPEWFVDILPQAPMAKTPPASVAAPVDIFAGAAGNDKDQNSLNARSGPSFAAVLTGLLAVFALLAWYMTR